MAPPPPSEAAGGRRQAVEACATMETCLETLKGGRDVSLPRPTKELLAAGATLLRTEAAKVGLLYNCAGSGPSEAEAKALLRSLTDAVGGVLMILMGAASTPAAGPTLRSAVEAAAERLVASCQELVEAAVGQGVKGEPLLQLVGRCMAQCEAVAKTPLDNRTALGRAITKVLKVLADASRELEEVAAEAEAEFGLSDGEAAPAAAGAAAEAGAVEADAEAVVAEQQQEEEESDEDADLLADEALTPAQAHVVRAVRSVLASCSSLLKAVVRALLAAPAGGEGGVEEGSSGVAEEWEALLFHVKALATSAEDMAAGVYPPQDADELSGAAEALVNCCELIVEECPVEGGDGEGAGEAPASAAAVAALQAALAQVERAAEELTEALSAES